MTEEEILLGIVKENEAAETNSGNAGDDANGTSNGGTQTSTEKVEGIEEGTKATNSSSTSNDSDDFLSNWDSDVNNQTTQTATKEDTKPSFDFSKFKDIVGDVKDESQLIDEIKKLKSEVDASKSAKFDEEKFYNDIPQDLAEAIKLAKQGGDYLDILGVSSIDYDGFSEADLYAHSIKDYFKTTEELNEYIESLSDHTINIEGRKVREMLKAQQKLNKESIIEKVKVKRQENESKLRSALDSISDVAGFKLLPAHKEQMYKTITEGKALEAVFGNNNGSYDYKKVAENTFKVMYFDKIVGLLKQNATTSAKRDIINSMSNTEVNKGVSSSNTAGETLSPIDLYLKSLRGE